MARQLGHSHLLTFCVFWTDEYGHCLTGPSSVWRVRRTDLSGAITAACNALKANQHGAEHARGFYVRSAEVAAS